MIYIPSNVTFLFHVEGEEKERKAWLERRGKSGIHHLAGESK
jgi:hypothetical protein